jgi:hypothetical protein
MLWLVSECMNYSRGAVTQLMQALGTKASNILAAESCPPLFPDAHAYLLLTLAFQGPVHMEISSHHVQVLFELHNSYLLFRNIACHSK